MSDGLTEQQATLQYRIGDNTYRLEELSWRQIKWLSDHVFKSLQLHRLDYAAVHDLLREDGPLFMAICLIAEGQTRRDHALLPFSAIQARADEFAGALTGGEVARFGPHFFRLCRPDQLAMLIPGATLQRLLADELSPSPSHLETGSSAVSSPSAAAMSPSSPASSPSGDRLIPLPTSGGVLSGTGSTAPSSDGSASSSPG